MYGASGERLASGRSSLISDLNKAGEIGSRISGEEHSKQGKGAQKTLGGSERNILEKQKDGSAEMGDGVGGQASQAGRPPRQTQ